MRFDDTNPEKESVEFEKVRECVRACMCACMLITLAPPIR